MLAEPLAATTTATTAPATGSLGSKLGGAKGRESAANSLLRPRRRVITLEDVRREYQAELDRAAAMENGRFAFAADDDDMDVL